MGVSRYAGLRHAILTRQQYVDSLSLYAHDACLEKRTEAMRLLYYSYPS